MMSPASARRGVDAGEASTPTQQFTLRIPMIPVGKGRPRFQRSTGRTYTPAQTESAEAQIRYAWIEAGRPRLPDDTPISVGVTLEIPRPAGHFKKNGELSAAGRRAGRVWCRQKPDIDNAMKLVMDALEGFAYRSDACVVELTASKLWTRGAPCVIVDMEHIGGEA